MSKVENTVAKGDLFFKSRLLQRHQKASLSGKGLKAKLKHLTYAANANDETPPQTTGRKCELSWDTPLYDKQLF